ncbi:hypothetical protein AVEN_84864-1 [Araneus ventricosus]|uniref:Uncharacterized protein n=1 Tax=Araneus ventricosus TaxID=182803 RepID=A0A4Y2T090_ARAVE|nr:hypothetical protein AVEN_84864-1 [Araneus ventricosus]
MSLSMLAVSIVLRAFKAVMVVGYGGIYTKSPANPFKKKIHGERFGYHGDQCHTPLSPSAERTIQQLGYEYLIIKVVPVACRG